MIGFHAEDNLPVDMIINAGCVVACLRSLICQEKGGDRLQLDGDAHHGLSLILEGVNNTLEAAPLKM